MSKELTKAGTMEAPRIVGADTAVSRCWTGPVFTPDPDDIELLAQRQQKRLQITLPDEGDWIEFGNGVTRRISYAWYGEGGEGGVQTSDGGSWHLHRSGTASFSGGLYGPVPPASLVDTGVLRPARFWFFHRDWPTAHHAVYCDVNVRVWQCNLPAPS